MGILVTLSITQRLKFATLDPKTRPGSCTNLQLELTATTLVSMELKQTSTKKFLRSAFGDSDQPLHPPPLFDHVVIYGHPQKNK